jgi:hypothetical protein
MVAPYRSLGFRIPQAYWLFYIDSVWLHASPRDAKSRRSILVNGVIENLPLRGSIRLFQIFERARIVLNAPDQGLYAPVGWLRKPPFFEAQLCCIAIFKIVDVLLDQLTSAGTLALARAFRELQKALLNLGVELY